MTLPKGYRYRYVGQGIGGIGGLCKGDELVFHNDDSAMMFPPTTLPFSLDQTTVKQLNDADEEAIGPEPDSTIQ